MPVGTQGTVKTVSAEDLEQIGFEQILSNTYHLSLRPTGDRLEKLGGLHKFMGWKGSILTDSGGYQVMSLSNMRDMKEEGVTFKSHLDGTQMFLSPEKSIQLQKQYGVDISMCLDECPPYPCSREEAASAMERTHRWAHRNLEARAEGQAIFGIVQGGVHMDLRTESAGYMSALPFEGFAVGGVSVGEPSEMQYPVVTHTAPLLPADKVRYLMGVGHPADILLLVRGLIFSTVFCRLEWLGTRPYTRSRGVPISRTKSGKSTTDQLTKIQCFLLWNDTLLHI
jgi:queuine tRNA-ribosyltransferase